MPDRASIWWRLPGLAQNSPEEFPGLNFFYEHVHLNFAGNDPLALNFAEEI